MIKKPRSLFIASVMLLLPCIGMGDVVVTKDDMILNGKIIEEVKNKYVKFANYHGMFTIYYAQIKEIHRTEKYEDDVLLFKKMGKSIDESVVKTNYQAGIEKLEAEKTGGKKPADDSIQYVLFGSPFIIFNTGDIRSVLPCSFGISVSGEIRFQTEYTYSPDGMNIDVQYFHAERDEKKISAFRSGLGAVWIIPVSIRGYSLPLALSPALGIGYYAVQGRYRETDGAKFHASFTAGPEFLISSWVISPRMRFDYIYDNAAPLFGIGFSMGAGYRF